MGYELQALVAKKGTFEHYRQLHDYISVNEIGYDLELLLNDVYLQKALKTQFIFTHSNFEDWFLADQIMEICSKLSRITPVAFLDAQYVGGRGYQIAVVWQDARLIMKQKTAIARVAESIGPINNALRVLGVIAASDKDEFETVGLNKHRNMEDWFEESTGLDGEQYFTDYEDME